MNNDTDLYEELKLKKRKPINLINNLFGREIGTNSSCLYINSLFNNDYSNCNEKTCFNQIKRIYLTITPNYSILNVKTPNCFLRRFSPDGKYLIAYNQHLNGIQIFLFRGCSSGIDDINHINTYNMNTNNNEKSEENTKKFKSFNVNDKTDFNDLESDQFRFKAFSTYFKEISNLRLTENNELINRECALFFNTHYLIVASSEIVNEENLPQYSDMAQNNEAILFSYYENYTIYLIDIRKAKLCDKLKFSADKINLTNNQSLCLFRNVFAVLSQQNQTIHIYNIIKPTASSTSKLKFVLVNSIGRFSYFDDIDCINTSLTLNSQYLRNLPSRNSSTSPRSRQANITPIKAYNEPCFTSMKHRILSYFYKEALVTNSLSQFYVNLNSILNLKMYRMQLLDENHVLIKYVNLDQMMPHKSTLTITASNSSSSTPRPSTAQSSSSNTTQPSSSNTPFEFILNNATSNTNTNSSTRTVNVNLSNQNSWGLTAAMSNVLNENSVPFYFVLYDMKSSTILNILRNTSNQLLNIYENFQDYFTLSSLDGYYTDNNYSLNSNIDTRNYNYGNVFTYHTLASNNMFAKQTMQRHIKNISRYNTPSEMTKCLLSHLPISSQSYCTSPYLDHSLFSYDEKLISNLERPKPIGDQIIKFNNRETGRLSFRMYPGLQTALMQNNNQRNHHSASLRRLVAVIWHPREPFCISVQRASTEYNVNFHVYSKNNLI